MSSKPHFSLKLTITLIVTLLLIATIILDIIIILDVQETRYLDSVSVTIKPNTNISFGKPAKVSDFLEHFDGTLIDDITINTNQLGEQIINFEYINIKNRQRPASFTINVIDDIAPQIFGGSTYTVPVGYEGELTDLMLSGDNLDDHPTREIIGTYNLTELGTYNLTYSVTDTSHNQTTKPFTLNVIKPTASDSDPYVSAKIPLTKAINDYKTTSTQIGIDVSQWQGEIDWPKVKHSGVEFAFIRVGYQAGYDGEYILDPYFEQNITEATATGLPVGIYFYSYANTTNEAERQAAWVLDQLDGRPAELGIAFDWENWSSFNQANVSFHTINQIAQHFRQTINQSGYQSLLYSSKNYLDLIWEPGDHPVWLAQYYHTPTYEGDFQIWQMGDSGQVPGINGDVDLDILYLPKLTAQP